MNTNRTNLHNPIPNLNREGLQIRSFPFHFIYTESNRNRDSYKCKVLNSIPNWFPHEKPPKFEVLLIDQLS